MVNEKFNHFHKIKKLSVIGGFHDGLELEFSDSLNCIIGARGTGKTTILELIRYALNNLPRYDKNSFEMKHFISLIKSNLKGGRIELIVETKDGLEYIITRSFEEDPIVLNIDRTPTDFDLIFSDVIGSEIYSQNQVENIADHPRFQLELIDKFVSKEIRDSLAYIKKTTDLLEKNASEIQPLQIEIQKLENEIKKLPTVEEKLKELSSDNKGKLRDEINKAHTDKAQRDREQKITEIAINTIQKYFANIEVIKNDIKHEAPSIIQDDLKAGPNKDIMSAIDNAVTKSTTEVTILLDNTTDRLYNLRSEIEEHFEELKQSHQQQEIEFRKLIEKHENDMVKTNERTYYEKLKNDLLNIKKKIPHLQEHLEKLVKDRTWLLNKLSEQRDERFSLRSAAAKMINKFVEPHIRVAIKQYGNVDKYKDLIEDCLRNSSRIKHGVVSNKISKNLSPLELKDIIRSNDIETLVDSTEINTEQAEKVISALNDYTVFHQLDIIDLDDEPRIQLKDGDNYKDSNSVSTGQKCTTILPILLLESVNPLLIDQPEDNLDNRFVFNSIVAGIRKIKSNRQLIFATHNPNIPVLGDAEKVFVLESDGDKSSLINDGDVEKCKKNIITLLEGGKEAFEARKDRYYDL